MKNNATYPVLMLIALFLAAAFPAGADIWVQCPGDTNFDGVSDTPGIRCMLTWRRSATPSSEPRG